MTKTGFFLLLMKRDPTQASLSKYLVHMVEKFGDEQKAQRLKETRKVSPADFPSHVCMLTLTLFSLHLLSLLFFFFLLFLLIIGLIFPTADKHSYTTGAREASLRIAYPNDLRRKD